MNRTAVNDMYSGINAPTNNPIAIINREVIAAIFLPNLSEINPNTYDPTNKALMVTVAVKNT